MIVSLRADVALIEVDTGHRARENWMGEEVETLADLLRPGLRAVIVGINPSTVSVEAGHYYQGTLGKLLWRRLREAGVLEAAEPGREDDDAFAAGSASPTSSSGRARGRTRSERRVRARAGRARGEAGRATRPASSSSPTRSPRPSSRGRFPGHGFVPGLEVAGIPVFVMPGPYERADRVAAALAELGALLIR